MDTKVIINAIILIIFVSIQYTLNLILRELRDVRKILIKDQNDINLQWRERVVWRVAKEKERFIAERI